MTPGAPGARLAADDLVDDAAEAAAAEAEAAAAAEAAAQAEAAARAQQDAINLRIREKEEARKKKLREAEAKAKREADEKARRHAEEAAEREAAEAKREAKYSASAVQARFDEKSTAPKTPAPPPMPSRDAAFGRSRKSSQGSEIGEKPPEVFGFNANGSPFYIRQPAAGGPPLPPKMTAAELKERRKSAASRLQARVRGNQQRLRTYAMYEERDDVRESAMLYDLLIDDVRRAVAERRAAVMTIERCQRGHHGRVSRARDGGVVGDAAARGWRRLPSCRSSSARLARRSTRGACRLKW